ncbi:hypothetical protein FO519_009480 [Halicephalobus sp. NKZ332]|nr:hypothetical protein FO519_009480 [Halicephalobus sp. NKZ332]
MSMNLNSLILCFLISLITVIYGQTGTTETCTCGVGTSSEGTEGEGPSCGFTLFPNNTATDITGCDCMPSYINVTINNTDDGYVAYCFYAEPTIPDYNSTYEFYGSCDNVPFKESKKKTTKWIFYIASIWVILWTIATIVINIVFKVKGHHRYIGILEEVTIVVLFIFLGFFVWGSIDSKTFCKATTIILHFTMLLFLAYCMMEAIFANSIVKGKSEINGSAPPLLNYILPIILAAIPAIASFFALKKYYAASGIHCFVMTYTNMLWAWSIPAWILLIVTLVIGQLAFLACVQEKEDADEAQLFWAKKCCKAMPFIPIFLLSTYFTAVFVLDFQRFWLAIVFFILCIMLGPLIFIIHTFCYIETATRLWGSTSLSIYRPCSGEKKPEEAEPEKDPEEEPETESSVPPPEEPPSQEAAPNESPQKPSQIPVENPRPPPRVPEKPIDPFHDPTNSQDFYDWLTDRNPFNIHDSEKILFKPRPV